MLYFYDKIIHHEKFKNFITKEYTSITKIFENESFVKLYCVIVWIW